MSPGRVAAVELSQGFSLPEEALTAGFVYLLLRWHGRPVGRLVLDEGAPRDPAALRDMVMDAAAAGVLAAEAEQASGTHPLAPLAPSPGAAPAAGEVSVVVATRDRPAELALCLEALGRLDPAPGEVVVADSASTAAAEVQAVAERAGARLVRADRAGLSRARNLGASAARGTILAFLDDDCRVDPGWLAALCRGFAAGEEVWAVTGQLLPAEVETEAQQRFVRLFHMDRRGFLPRRFTARSRPSPSFPLDAWRMGSGGNLAVRAAALARLGGFRLALGLGTPARGGEDLFFLWSALTRGGAVVYRPDALAWHRHHRDLSALSRVLFGYGAGHTAYLVAARSAGASRRAIGRYLIGFAADRAVRLGRSLLGLSPLPAAFVLRELCGSVAGLALARRARREEG